VATTALVWFRNDLRLTDNPALTAALRTAGNVIPVFVYAPDEHGDWAPGAASRWWLHHSLEALDRSLRARGARLILRRGNTLEELIQVANDTSATAVFWNRRYEPALVARDRRIKQALTEHGLNCQSFNASLLLEPWEVLNASGQPYRVFTAFWRASQRQLQSSAGLAAPKTLGKVAARVKSAPLSKLELLPKVRWDQGMRAHWQISEDAAHMLLSEFCGHGLADYAHRRDHPAGPGTSRLSPYLHFGQLSPRQILTAAASAGETVAEPFIRQLGWRDFAHHLLYHFPRTAAAPLDERFAHFPWARSTRKMLRAWQRGETGFPIVDAGMRELWHTGWMHNRVRMVVASLLTKNLLIPWQEGARWFWDTLVDADLANNTLGWQWSAGCGADAAPYFRIFNPVRQSEKFDASGAYLRRWLPELAKLPDRYLHAPWQAAPEVLDKAGVRLGKSYPNPVIDLASSRARALEAWSQIKANRG